MKPGECLSHPPFTQRNTGLMDCYEFPLSDADEQRDKSSCSLLVERAALWDALVH